MSRIILKISGEGLKSNNEQVSSERLNMVLKLVSILKENNHKVGIVVGGGNFFRGRDHGDMDTVTADTIGMLGTVMNALYMKDYLVSNGISSEVSTPFSFPGLLEDYTNDNFKEMFDTGKVIIFGGGVGKSGYSTDSGTILATSIVDADLIIKLTNVDGVYSDDPKINKDATKFDTLTYDEVLNNGYGVMDAFAIEECKNKNIKILVMDFNKYNEINDYFEGKNIGTIIGV